MSRSLSPNEHEDEILKIHNAAIYQDIQENLRKFKKNEQSNYRQILDEQLKHKELLVRQGNMTQMEKSLNKGELKDFKTNGGGVQVNAMIPGIFNESPLRHKVVPRKTYRELMRERSAQNSPIGITEDYNTDMMLPG